MFEQNEFWENYTDFQRVGFYTEGPEVSGGSNHPYYIAEAADSDEFSGRNWLEKVEKIQNIISDIIANPWKLTTPITIHFWWDDEDGSQW